MNHKTITVITGPLRSGTSCLTGLLEMCGFDLGKNIRVLKRPTEHNPKGHFETDLMFTINYRLIGETKPDFNFYNPPLHKDLKQHAESREKYFDLFTRKFDGNLLKDPLLCFTYSMWRQRWSRLGNAIYCLRNPLSVAKSMVKRYGFTLEQGLEAWQTYTDCFMKNMSAVEADYYIFDFDAFQKNPIRILNGVLQWLEHPFDIKDIEKYIEEFYSADFVQSSTEALTADLPQEIRRKYDELCEKSP